MNPLSSVCVVWQNVSTLNLMWCSNNTLTELFFIDMNKVYVTVLSRHHHLVRKSDGNYDPMEYENHPELYTSHFRTSVSYFSSLPLLAPPPCSLPGASVSHLELSCSIQQQELISYCPAVWKSNTALIKTYSAKALCTQDIYPDFVGKWLVYQMKCWHFLNKEAKDYLYVSKPDIVFCNASNIHTIMLFVLFLHILIYLLLILLCNIAFR